MTKAANNGSSIYKGKEGSWHGWVSFGEGPDGRRRRKHVRGLTKREVAEKVQRLERQRAGGYLGDRPLSVSEWLELWIAIRVTTGARSKTVEGYRTDQRHITRAIGEILLNRLSAEHIDRLWTSIITSKGGPGNMCPRAAHPVCRFECGRGPRAHGQKPRAAFSGSPV
jgi:hypothetical protein